MTTKKFAGGTIGGTALAKVVAQTLVRPSPESPAGGFFSDKYLIYTLAELGRQRPARILICGGDRDDSLVISTEVENRWEAVRIGNGVDFKQHALTVGDHVFVTQYHTDFMMEYDTATWSCEDTPTMPIKPIDCGSPGLVAIGTRIYSIGGGAGRTPLGACWVYDTVARTWTALGADKPSPMFGFTTAVVGRRIFTFGGRARGTVFDTAEVLDTATGKWTRLAPMPFRRCGMAAAVHGRQIWCFGGNDGDHNLDVIVVYDVDTGTWHATSHVMERPATAEVWLGDGECTVTALSVDDDIWVIAGGSWVKFSPRTGVWSRRGGIPQFGYDHLTTDAATVI